MIGLSLVSIVCAIGYFCISNQTTSIQNARGKYISAVNAIPDSYQLNIKQETTITVADKIYNDVISSTLFYVNDSGNKTFKVTGTIQSGLTATATEYYTDGMLYLDIQDQHFSSKISDEELLSRYTPASVFTESLYQTVTGYKSGKQITIEFKDPTAPEIWAVPNNNAFRSAEGVATLNLDGTLKNATYTVSYKYGNADIAKVFHITIKSTGKNKIIIPENTEEYINISYIDGPVLLEKTCGILLQEACIQSTIEEYMYCGIFGDQRHSTTELNIQGLNPADICIHTKTITSNSSQPGSMTSETTVFEQFTNGTYSIVRNGGAAEIDSGVSDAYMREYGQNILLGTLLLQNHIKNVELTQNDSCLVITYDANETLSQIISENICNTLYQDPSALSSKAADHTIIETKCFLELDSTTGLPHRSGIIYKGSYMIDDVTYPLEYEITQTYNA